MELDNPTQLKKSGHRHKKVDRSLSLKSDPFKPPAHNLIIPGNSVAISGISAYAALKSTVLIGKAVFLAQLPE
jgi:hypothetical protein